MRGELETPLGPTAAGDGGLDFLAPSEKPDSLGRLVALTRSGGRRPGRDGGVLKAFDENLHRVVAIKVMAPQLAASATARKRFTREARAAAAVTHDARRHHPRGRGGRPGCRTS